jgi:hypothetical protein
VAPLDYSGDRLQRLKERFAFGPKQVHFIFLDDDDDEREFSRG